MNVVQIASTEQRKDGRRGKGEIRGHDIRFALVGKS